MAEDSFLSLARFYQQMDKQWDITAAEYHFECTGCKDNCCTALFFHHSYIEKAYFLKGFQTLAADVQKKILDRAHDYCNKTFRPDAPAKSLKIMCPANDEGKCLLYHYRPMICRLHGLPHEVIRPGSEPVMGKGCPAGGFDRFPYKKFDRTPFYQQMARLEIEFRQASGMSGKIKQSIAQILMSQ
ncbi:MAG: hypothetical protein KKE62_08595 [Proteobacteria bacterium]|nr:hypothetical protein [Pseudomonadota bacterium]MBU1388289.1 hypothetical protein [Pseudomonadota bacterium]MBU1542894.1 hypothetical protein [Pseudomonadota bacterium]MBU2480791.1 hypothetical protein [Pseudomonadota bacterium]